MIGDIVTPTKAQPPTTNESTTQRANENKRLPFEFASFDTTNNGQISQEQYSKYWGNIPEYTQAIFNFYDKDGIAGLSKEEFDNAKTDLQKIEEEGMHVLWNEAITTLLNLGVSKFSYAMIQNAAKLLEKAFVVKFLEETTAESTQENNQQELSRLNSELQIINFEIGILKIKLQKAGIDTERKFFESSVAIIKENRNSIEINNNVPYTSTAQPFSQEEKENAVRIQQLYNLEQSKIKVQHRIEELEKLEKKDTNKNKNDAVK